MKVGDRKARGKWICVASVRLRPIPGGLADGFNLQPAGNAVENRRRPGSRCKTKADVDGDLVALLRFC
jgi:hypothetical protein